MLQSEANECAMKLKKNNFTASNGWLKSFCDRHQIKFSNLHGESADVSVDAVQQWMQDLPKIPENYALHDIYNCDETFIFFKALPKKTLLVPKEQPAGDKQSKERLSILACANAIGEKAKLLVIGKSKHPHSFPRNTSDLEQHVTYRHNKRGWMTTPIFTEFLNSLNNRMRHQGRKIFMFLDNCSLHPHLNLSNIKLCFYPKNTTSWLQAMDQGVIANLKKKYNKRMLNVARIKAKTSQWVTDIVKEIKIFDTILHARGAWEAIEPETTAKCFKWSGIQENYDTPPSTPEPVDEDLDFPEYFENLLNITWDEY